MAGVLPVGAVGLAGRQAVDGVTGRELVPCAYCGRAVDPDAASTYRQVIGWEHPRSAGGTNALAARQPQNTYACDSCIYRLRKGLSPHQQVLL